LRLVKGQVEIAGALAEIAELTETVHGINHTICDALTAQVGQSQAVSPPPLAPSSRSCRS
jgi:hypothetical protein